MIEFPSIKFTREFRIASRSTIIEIKSLKMYRKFDTHIFRKNKPILNHMRLYFC